MSVVDDSLDHPMKLEERAAIPLAGGIMGQGYQCGMLWGAALAAGAQVYRQLKAALAEACGSDIGAYVDGKAGFVQKILILANAKAASR